MAISTGTDQEEQYGMKILMSTWIQWADYFKDHTNPKTRVNVECWTH